jgi:hypothetical protein
VDSLNVKVVENALKKLIVKIEKKTNFWLVKFGESIRNALS